MKTYTAQVGPDNAALLSTVQSDAPDGPTIEDIGEGTVQVNDLDRLRKLGAEEDGSVTDDEDGLQIWVGGEGYPLFDEVDAAVADALGSQTLYVEAKRNSDRAAAAYARAVATAVRLAGSVPAAAELLGMDEAEVASLAAQGEPEGTVA
ncbi:MAG TPA: hypothetical protein VKB69_00120 [Micromonosporaceae bacterium]|nr:hypothetical protein [Micromonosporaceae bacterium]